MISVEVRGFSEKLCPVALSVVLIRKAARTRADSPALGSASFIKTWKRSLNGGLCFSCLRRITVERRCVAKGYPHPGLGTFRTNEGVDQGAKPLKRQLPAILQDRAQQLRGLVPFIALQSKEDGGLVGEVLVERSNADSGFLPPPARVVKRWAPSFSKTRTAPSRMAATSSFDLDWLGCFPRGDLWFFGEWPWRCKRNANAKCDGFVVF